MRFKHILVIARPNYPPAWQMAKHVQAWLAQKGVGCQLVEAGAALNLAPFPDMVIALGGDGTILGIARKLAGSPTPIFGINFGTVGFLTAFDSNNWQSGLEQAFSGLLSERACMALKWSINRQERKIRSGVAINDVVVARGCLARLTSIEVRIDSERMGVLRSDGIIITSPLGSSGYSASAGGPALHPALNVLGLTPICSFMPNVSPLVLPGSACFQLTVLDSSGDCYLTIDGQEGEELAKRDTVKIMGWPAAIHFLGEDKSFFERLKGRAFALEDSRRQGDQPGCNPAALFDQKP